MNLRGEHHLSPREKEALRLMTEGHSNSMICKKMKIRPGTLSTYITGIARALHIETGSDMRGGALHLRVGLQRLLFERVTELESEIKRLEEENMSLRSRHARS